MPTLQANSSQCFVCGMANPFGLKIRFYEDEPGSIFANYMVPEHYQSYPGIVHGGIVAAMLDETASRVYMGNGSPRFMYTARLTIQYRRKVPLGQPLRLVGKAKTSKGRIAAASSAIYDQEGNLLAEAEAVLVEVPNEDLAGVDLEAMGWKVYQEDRV